MTPNALRLEVSRLGLAGRERVLALSSDGLAAAYNGTGPEFLPARIRARLDAAAAPFLPAVMVHDVDFTFSDGTFASFREANVRLLVNCVTCAMDAHPWHDWRRYALILEAVMIYRACKRFGWIAWRSAHRKAVRGVPPRPAPHSPVRGVPPRPAPHSPVRGVPPRPGALTSPAPPVPEAPSPRGVSTTNTNTNNQQRSNHA